MFNNDCIAYKGSIFYFKDSATFENLPKKRKEQSSTDCQYVYIKDGIVVVENGKIKAVGNYSDFRDQLDGIQLVDYTNKLITPGFIDTHHHATQSTIVAAYGEKLLEWLNDYVFPGESIYNDTQAARTDLSFFLDHLIRNGTTSAAAYGPLFYDAADIFFEELSKRNMRYIAGNIIMDFNSPDYLMLPTEKNYDITKKLIAKWHNKNRISFGIAPRFALACSEKMMELCGSLVKENPDIYIQTHLDENLAEVAEVKKIYPWSKNYLDVYHRYGLVNERTILGHCVHTTTAELELIKATGAIISWCPTSNNFLGSGLFNLEKSFQYTNKVTLATDWGGGNTLSMLRVMDDGYKVAMLNNYKFPSMLRWYMATLGAAKSLQMDDKIGNFSVGKEADFIVIDPDATAITKHRHQNVEDIFELLFILMSLGDERNIRATYIYGEPAYINRSSEQHAKSKTGSVSPIMA